MPNASGYVTAPELRRMHQMARSGMSNKEIAAVIGCQPRTVANHLGVASDYRRQLMQRYDRFVALASAYVPTFGGGR